MYRRPFCVTVDLRAYASRAWDENGIYKISLVNFGITLIIFNTGYVRGNDFDERANCL